jgi:LPS-assembly protein
VSLRVKEITQLRLATSIVLGLTLSGAPAIGLSADESPRGIACWPPVPLTAPADFGAEDIELTSGDADIQANGSAIFNGPIELRSTSRSLKADSAVYDSEQEVVQAKGDVEYEDPLNSIKGESVEYNTATGQFKFSDAEFELRDIPVRGSAKRIAIVEPGVLELQRVKLTSCPEGRDDWLLRAKRLELNKNTGMGTARGASLAFKGVPFFYVPYFTYPITDDRKSGLLLPEFGTSNKRGFEYTQPIYWNISPGMDATYTPRYMADRGLQHGLETRYLTNNNAGVLYGDFLDNDDETDTKRWQYEVETQTFLPFGIRASLYGAGVSDDDYFEDMGRGVVETSQTHLNREAALEYYDTVWSVKALVQDYQTIDPSVTDPDDPYSQAPRLDANAFWHDGLLGLDYGFDS